MVIATEFCLVHWSASLIRNFGIRIGSEGRGVWALRWKLVGLPAGLAEPSGEVGPVSQAPVDSVCQDQREVSVHISFHQIGL